MNASIKNLFSRFKPSPKTGLITLGVLIVLFLLYVVAGFWIIPSYITSKAKSIAKEKWQRELTIKSLEMNPFSFTVDIKGFHLSEAKSDATFVSFDQLFVDLSAYSLLKLTPVVTEFKLVKPYAKLIRFNENKRNFDDIVAFFESDPKDTSTEKEKVVEEKTSAPRNAQERQAMYAKRKFGLYNVQLIDARFEFENQELGTKTVINDFNVGMPLVYRGPFKGVARFVEPKFEAMINGKKLEIISEIPDPNSHDRRLRLSFNNIDLKRIFNYVPFHSQYQFKEGWLDLNLSAYFHRPKEGQNTVDFGGEVTLRSIHMTQGKMPLLDVEKIAIDLGTLSPTTGSFQLKKVEVIRPEIHAIKNKDGVLNFANLLAKTNQVTGLTEKNSGSTQTVSYQEAAKQKDDAELDQTIYSLEALEIKKAKVRYDDESLANPISAQISNVDLNLNRIALRQNAFNIDEIILANAKVDASLEKKSNPSNTPQSEALPLTIHVSKVLLQNLQGQIKNKIASTIDSIPFAMNFQNAKVEIKNVDAKLATNDIHCEELRTSGVKADVMLLDHPDVVSQAAPPLPYLISIDQIDFNPKEIHVKNQNTHLLAEAPKVTKLANLQFHLENVKAHLPTGKIDLEKLKIANGQIVAAMEPQAPKMPKEIGKGAPSPYHMTVRDIELHTNVHLTNSNKNDPFQMPYSLQLSPLALSLNQIDANLTTQQVSVQNILTKNTHATITLDDFRKPTDYGERTYERAKLMEQILAKKKHSPGLVIKADHVDIANWKAELKNNNKTDRAGIPIAALVEKLNLTIQKIQFDSGTRSLNVGSITSKSSEIKGQIIPHESYIVKYKAYNKPISIPSDALAISVDKVDISGWNLKGRNLNLKKSLGAALTDFSIVADHISSKSDKKGHFSVRAKVNESGRLAVDGELGLFPLQLDANLNLDKVSVVLIQPYIDDYVNLTLDSALLSMQGKARFQEETSGLVGGYDGNITISQVQTSDKTNGNMFSRWDSLDLKNVQANLSPLTVRIKEAQLNNFFSRVIVSADGRINIQNILKSAAGGQVSLTETDQELDELASLGHKEKLKIVEEHKKARERRHERRERRRKQHEEQKEEIVEAKYPDVFIDKLLLKGGRVRMTDSFIKPNYTALISDMEGSISPISLDSQTWSKIDLKGKVNNAPLVANGAINLLKDPFALELKAQVKGMELAQLSAYTNKFIGYGIKKGKMSCDIEYKIENGELVAKNRLILDQLTFDEQSTDKAKMTLPVQLAVNLLKDSNGVIDINLPIEGSLDNPNFSLGDIIAKVFFNSIKSILFSPFSFLNGSGNSHEAWLAFEPGTAVLLEKEKERIAKIVEAFTKYPKLKLDITGVYDLVADKKGIAKVALKRQGRMEKYKDLIAKGDKLSPMQMPYSDQEYASFIKDLYKKGTFDKPKNLLFLEKSLSLSEMEDLLVDHANIQEEDFVKLAYQRAESVKTRLIEAGVSDQRIFILASKKGQASESGETATRVDLSFAR